MRLQADTVDYSASPVRVRSSERVQRIGGGADGWVGEDRLGDLVQRACRNGVEPKAVQCDTVPSRMDRRSRQRLAWRARMHTIPPARMHKRTRTHTHARARTHARTTAAALVFVHHFRAHALTTRSDCRQRCRPIGTARRRPSRQGTAAVPPPQAPPECQRVIVSECPSTREYPSTCEYP